MQTANIKNMTEFCHIPPEELFISDSGYAYNIYEIASFIRGGETFHQYKLTNEEPGAFRDFKNKETDDCLLNSFDENYRGKVFTEQDIHKLLSFVIIKEAIENKSKENQINSLNYILFERNK